MRRHALIILLIATLHGGFGVTLAAIAAHTEMSSFARHGESDS